MSLVDETTRRDGPQGVAWELQALLGLSLQPGAPVPRMLLPDEAQAIMVVVEEADSVPGSFWGGEQTAALLTEIVRAGRDPRVFAAADPDGFLGRSGRVRQYPTVQALTDAVARGHLAVAESSSGPGGYTRVRPAPRHDVVTRTTIPATAIVTNWDNHEVWTRADGGAWVRLRDTRGRFGWRKALAGNAVGPLVELIADEDLAPVEVVRWLRLSPRPWEQLLAEAEDLAVTVARVPAARVRQVHEHAHAVLASTELQPHRLVLHVTDADLAAESYDADADLAVHGPMVRVHQVAAKMIRTGGAGWWPVAVVWPSRQQLIGEAGTLLEQQRPGLSWLAEPIDTTAGDEREAQR